MNKTATAVLAQLSKSSDYVSGAALARQLNVTRTAIWKAISSLKKEGFVISSKPHLGYLLEDSDKLNSFAIMHNAFHPKNVAVHVFDTINSTNTYAKQLITNNPTDTTTHVIVAANQTASYGRFARQFNSPDGGIYLTVTLNLNHPTINPGLITTMAALAVHQTIYELCHVTTQIKWVNDILLANKKICGILCEGISDMETGQIKHVIIGIGLNFKTDISSFPEELQKIIGTLKADATKHNVSTNQFVGVLVAKLLAMYQQLPETSFMDEYRKYCTIINQTVTLKTISQTITQTVATVDDAGRLVLADGRRFSAGEIIKTNPS